MMQMDFVPFASRAGGDIPGILPPKKSSHSRGGFALLPEGRPGGAPAEATGTGGGSPWR